MDMIQTLAQELNKDPRHVENVVRLLDEGNTIPFIARYRKELHGAMDDTSLRTLEERLHSRMVLVITHAELLSFDQLQSLKEELRSTSRERLGVQLPLYPVTTAGEQALSLIHI